MKLYSHQIIYNSYISEMKTCTDQLMFYHPDDHAGCETIGLGQTGKGEGIIRIY